jgi:membrane protein implicated in regulation of membrane protease activity
MTTWYWAIAAGIVAYVEMHAPGFYLIWIACGAATTAAAVGTFDLSTEAQLITFAAASAAFCIAGYFVYRHLNSIKPNELPLNRRELQIIGKEGVVYEPLINGYGKVRLGDTVWLAEGPDLPAEAPIVVRGLRGTTVVVEGRARQPA